MAWNAVQSSSVSFGDVDLYAFLLAYKNGADLSSQCIYSFPTGMDSFGKVMKNTDTVKVLTEERIAQLQQTPIQFVLGVNAVDKEEVRATQPDPPYNSDPAHSSHAQRNSCRRAR